MRLGKFLVYLPRLSTLTDILKRRFIHKKTLNSQPLRVVDYCAYISELFFPNRHQTWVARPASGAKASFYRLDLFRTSGVLP